jgi:acyl carrier protein
VTHYTSFLQGLTLRDLAGRAARSFSGPPAPLLPGPAAASRRTQGSGSTQEPGYGDAIEKTLAIWRDPLDVPEISVDDNFFELGRHSLLAIRMLARIRSEMDVALPLRAVVDYPSVRQLSEQIDTFVRG